MYIYRSCVYDQEVAAGEGRNKIQLFSLYTLFVEEVLDSETESLIYSFLQYLPEPPLAVVC